ncbi:Exosc7 [Symbiodinium sp. KB8]|nr:Exosc7 [Symbiodinium sp. KB8]
MLCSASELRYAKEGVKCGVRVDGRARNELRPMVVECDLFPQPNGSARVTVPPSGSDAVAGVKADIVEVDPATPDQGVVEVSVSLCAPGAFDLAGLCIAKGRYAWRIFVDVTVLQLRGNAVGTVSLAAYAALQRARLPKLRVSAVSAADGFEEADEAWDPASGSSTAPASSGAGEQEEAAAVDVEIEVVDDADASVSLADLCSADKAPVCVSYAVVDGVLVVDPLPEEESGAQATVRVSVNRSGAVVAVRTAEADAALGVGAAATTAQSGDGEAGAEAAAARVVTPLAAGMVETALGLARDHAATLFAAVDSGMAAASRRATAMEEADARAVRALAERYGDLPAAAAAVADSVMADASKARTGKARA